eukprot:4028726-Amphidinium_carterae.1
MDHVCVEIQGFLGARFDGVDSWRALTARICRCWIDWSVDKCGDGWYVLRVLVMEVVYAAA